MGNDHLRWKMTGHYHLCLEMIIYRLENEHLCLEISIYVWKNNHLPTRKMIIYRQMLLGQETDPVLEL